MENFKSGDNLRKNNKNYNLNKLMESQIRKPPNKMKKLKYLNKFWSGMFSTNQDFTVKSF